MSGRILLPRAIEPTPEELEELAKQAYVDVWWLVGHAVRPLGFPECEAYYRARFRRDGFGSPPGAWRLFRRAFLHACARYTAWEGAG
jgi:hypothetical protein